MIDSQAVLYSTGKNDEYRTMPEAIYPLLRYIPRGAIIWCPFDTADSNFVKILTANGWQVEYSHISTGQDFYTYEPDRWDIIISNPPFTNKRHIFERTLSFDKPFALIMSNTWLNDAAPKQLFGNNMELLMFEERMKFMDSNGEVLNKITFSSSYFCYHLLPRPIIVEKLQYDD